MSREALIGAITTFLSGHDPRLLDEIGQSLNREIDAAGSQALAQLGRRFVTTGANWDYYPADPLARRIHHVLADRLLQPDSAVFGIEHLTAVAGRPAVIFANHLSYSDANLLEILLNRAGGAEVSDRLTAVAGPKVYSSPKRRFSTLCFGTIKTPQSSAVSSEDAVMNPREVARLARRVIDLSHERLRQGDALLLFAEGTRSRTREMQPMLAGATRYLDGPEAAILPVGITGTEELFPIGAEEIHPVRIVAHIGHPIPTAALLDAAAGNRRLVMDAIGLAIARLLPPEYRGAYADDAPDLDDARRLIGSIAQ
jgi:1-acyl-sn-glycerol-3-phosphate acyltransferase